MLSTVSAPNERAKRQLSVKITDEMRDFLDAYSRENQLSGASEACRACIRLAQVMQLAEAS